MTGFVQVGDLLADRFEVFEIHQGGMGVVYSARDRAGRSGREFVALKTLRGELLVNRERGGRFAEECRLWTHLGQHPNVVQAYSIDQIEGRPHIVLELVRGGELKERIGTPKLDLPLALKYGVEFCLGMEHAIRQGLRCHRDIKPGNLLVSDTGTLKITDFGLAGIRDELLAAGLDGPESPIPLADEAPHQPIVWADLRDHNSTGAPIAPYVEPPNADDTKVNVYEDPADSDTTVAYMPPKNLDTPSTLISHLTQSGALLGTLPYMAPEQFRDAHRADIRADIYSFGVVLFQMLTATLPFKGTTIAKIKRQHSQYDPPSVIPSIPKKYSRNAADVDKLIRRCLAKNPEDRFEDIPELRGSLTRVLHRVAQT